MKKTLSKLLSFLVVTAIVLTAIPFVSTVAYAANTADLATQINAVDGLSAAVEGSTVNVTGTAARNANLALSIDAGVTVNWNATLTGNATANNYLLTLSGSGAFTLYGGGSISATSGAGGTMYISDGVTLNVSDGGSIENPGSGSAVTIAAGTQNAEINVCGGAISSMPNGYAINDGSGMSASANNTQINISSGLVEAGSACAIRSTGIASVVAVSGGEVRNAAASNTNSVIYMNYAPAPDNGLNNIIVSGGLVRTANAGNQSYVLQTSQNVLISGGEVQALAGRAINLVGGNSTAAVTGGRVSTVSGTAISTATTTLDEVNNAKIVISGGIVEATGTGRAVVITGYNSTAEISGDAQVLAKSGLAIDASGRPAAGSVTVSGGFVFAWGDGITGSNNVVNPSGKLNSAVGGYIAAWDTATGIGADPYQQDGREHLSMMPADSVYWDDGGTAGDYSDDGIKYGSKVFPLNVETVRNVYTLTIETKLDGVAESAETLKVSEGIAVRIATRDDTPVNQSVNPNLTPANGDKFIDWTSAGGGTIGNESARDTTFIMPGADAVVTANYKTRHLLHTDGLGGVIVEPKNFGGSASYGYYAEGDEIIISASWNSSTMYFNYWSSSGGGTIADAGARVTKFTMPGNSVTVTANPSGTPIPSPSPHKTSLVNGGITATTAGAMPDGYDEHTGLAGTGLRIEAVVPAGSVFAGWSSSDGGWFADKNSPDTVFVMPNNDTTVTANYVPGFTLSVENGIAADTASYYKAGEQVHVIADPVGTGKKFIGWEPVSPGGGSFANASAASAIFTMPAANAEIRAVYADIQYTLTIINRTGEISAVYIYGEAVPVTADAPTAGMKFDGWVIISGSGSFGDDSKADTSFTMPAENVIIKAAYSVINPVYPDEDIGSGCCHCKGCMKILCIIYRFVINVMRRTEFFNRDSMRAADCVTVHIRESLAKNV